MAATDFEADELEDTSPQYDAEPHSDELEDQLDEIERRAGSADLPVSRDRTPESTPALRIRYGDGQRVGPFRDVITVTSTATALELLATPFEHQRLVPGYWALFDSTTQSIEARVRGSWAPVQSIPGLPLGHTMASPDNSVTISVVPASPVLRDMGPRGYMRDRSGLRVPAPVLRLEGFSPQNTDDAVDVLETIADSLLLDIDLTHGIPVSLVRRTSPRRRTAFRSRQDVPASFPMNSYHKEPLRLYKHGRAMVGIPNFEFLAYYQATEFFFPSYADEALRNRVSRVVKDPRFSAHKEQEIGRIVEIVRGARGHGFSPESEQLRDTMRACLEEGEIREFIAGSDAREKHFCDRRTRLKVPPVSLKDTKSNLIDACASRLYKLRCKIVHAKENEGTGEPVDLILPESPEADLLHHDIELMRLVAARVLTASSAPLTI